tara:strand:+ start:164 stop:370 length:207 start_codon:yes stop_codon:yes gene_type:complete
VTEEEKLEFYKSEYKGAPLSKHLTFRCTEPLAVWLKTKGLEEARDYSSVIRRLVIKAAQEEGFNRHGV